MKQYLLAGLLAVGTVGVGRAQAQQSTTLPLDSLTHKITYSAVVQVPGASQAELYGRALRWLAGVVPGTATAPQVADAASGLLAARVGLPFAGSGVVGTVQYTLWRRVTIQVKDGRAKYEFSDFEAQPYWARPGLPPPNDAQQKLTLAEAYLNRGNSIYYTRQGQAKSFVTVILDAVGQQSAAQVASLKAALAKANDF